MALSFTRIQVTSINHFNQAQYQTSNTNIKVSIIGGLDDMQGPCINKGLIEQTCRETNVKWHQDQSGGYASLCRSGSQGTVRPPIKSRLAVGCRDESAQLLEPSLKEGLAFNNHHQKTREPEIQVRIWLPLSALKADSHFWSVDKQENKKKKKQEQEKVGLA
ncbi:predicted protein [Lichtheimia corymbifera JMRC:FSU:9682]|uniref:Uncharacterized protein n=1 Tax=Lichtheimia corymbifera JMRC:FSU:9682 TaxID=1263082 RepID=A0A068SED7_9FUNG|nr:predicted protein [Lichtheimia corymbifera JMRC:FSU:9682]